MKTTKRLILTIALAAATMAAQAQLLWRISGNGLEQPSYVFGTHHIAPKSILDSVPQVRQVQKDVRQVCGEVNMLNMQQAMRATAEAMLLPSGKSLNDYLPDDKRNAVDEVLKKYVGVGVDNGAVQRMCPAAVTNQIVTAMATTKMTGEDADFRIDVYFQTKADKAGKKVVALETVQQQLKLLFSQTPYRQATMLACVAENIDWEATQMEMLTDAYMRRDLAAIEEISNQEQGDDCDYNPEEKAALTTDRNRAWVEQMPAMMASNPTLFVVGVAHLVGEEGLIKLLTTAGYKVEAVDKK